MNTYGEDTTAVQIASDSLQQDSVPTALLDDEEDARDYFVESSSDYNLIGALFEHEGKRKTADVLVIFAVAYSQRRK